MQVKQKHLRVNKKAHNYFRLHSSLFLSLLDKKYIFDSQQLHEDFKMYLHSFTHKSQVLQGRHTVLPWSL